MLEHNAIVRIWYKKAQISGKLWDGFCKCEESGQDRATAAAAAATTRPCTHGSPPRDEGLHVSPQSRHSISVSCRPPPSARSPRPHFDARRPVGAMARGGVSSQARRRGGGFSCTTLPIYMDALLVIIGACFPMRKIHEMRTNLHHQQG